MDMAGQYRKLLILYSFIEQLEGNGAVVIILLISMHLIDKWEALDRLT